MTKSKTFDKYYYYHSSVQSSENDVEFFDKTYKKIRGKEAKIFREDFCGTHALSCEWVKLGKDKISYGFDIDQEPIDYGQIHYAKELNEHQRKRLNIANRDVLKANTKSDITVAVNFSYFIFKKREILKAYFTNCYKSLNKNGVFVVDVFGGSACLEPNEEETEYTDRGYSYFWDQDNYNPITNEALFYIHFKRAGEKKRTKVFTYDWRMWSIPELTDILQEVGFKKSTVYWEGTDKSGSGNGIFKPTTKGECCEGWIAYIFAEK